MDPRMREDDAMRALDPRMREDDAMRALDPRIREDDDCGPRMTQCGQEKIRL